MSQYDPLPGMPPGPDGSATRAVDVVPADNVPLPMVARFLYLGTGGDIKLVLRDDLKPVTLHGLASGYHKLWTKQIWATGTTAGSIVALA